MADNFPSNGNQNRVVSLQEINIFSQQRDNNRRNVNKFSDENQEQSDHREVRKIMLVLFLLLFGVYFAIFHVFIQSNDKQQSSLRSINIIYAEVLFIFIGLGMFSAALTPNFFQFILHLIYLTALTILNYFMSNLVYNEAANSNQYKISLLQKSLTLKWSSLSSAFYCAMASAMAYLCLADHCQLTSILIISFVIPITYQLQIYLYSLIFPISYSESTSSIFLLGLIIGTTISLILSYKGEIPLNKTQFLFNNEWRSTVAMLGSLVCFSTIIFIKTDYQQNLMPISVNTFTSPISSLFAIGSCYTTFIGITMFLNKQLNLCDLVYIPLVAGVAILTPSIIIQKPAISCVVGIICALVLFFVNELFEYFQINNTFRFNLIICSSAIINYFLIPLFRVRNIDLQGTLESNLNLNGLELSFLGITIILGINCGIWTALMILCLTENEVPQDDNANITNNSSQIEPYIPNLGTKIQAIDFLI